MSAEAFNEVQAVVLAGGMGTRLSSVVSDRPKVLAEVYGRPYLFVLLDQIAESGLQGVILATGFLGDQVESTIGKTYRGLSIQYSQESCPLGTGGALRASLPLIHSQSVLVMNGDSYCDVEFNEFWSSHCNDQAKMTIVLTHVENSDRFGNVQTDRKNRIIQFSEKCSAGQSGWINAGIYLSSRTVIEEIPGEQIVSLEQEVFPNLIGHGLHCYKTHGRFLDIGTPESYRIADRFFSTTHSN